MSIITYSKAKSQKLSDHFTSYEFRCGIGRYCGCSTTLIDPKLVEILEKIRAYFGKPITITSGYRCESYNRSVGGATGSYHSRGMAADIVVSGIPPKAVAAYAESIGVNGIGLYETGADGYFVHVDTRTYKSYWYGQAQAARTTFGGEANCIAYKAKSTTASTNTPPAATTAQAKVPYNVTVTATALNVRSGASTSFACIRVLQNGNIQTVVEESNGWGKLQSGGWIYLQYTAPITETASTAKLPRRVKVVARELNVRSDAGVNNTRLKTIQQNTIHTVVEEKDGWGKIESGGWIYLAYVVPAA